MKNLFYSTLNIIYLLLLTLGLIACGSETTAPTVNDSGDNSSRIEMPFNVQKISDAGGTVRAYIEIDGDSEKRQEMVISTDSNGVEIATLTITGLSLVPHSFTIVYEYTDTNGTITLARASRMVNVTSTGVNVNFPSDGYNLNDFDEDGDGINNVAEIIRRQNPRRSDPLSISPITQSLITNTRPIVFNFNSVMDITSLSLTGLLTDSASSVSWVRVQKNNDTLLITPDTSWNEGVQTLTLSINNAQGTLFGPIVLNYSVDSTIPTAIPSPSSGATLQNTTPIVIQFSESMDISSLVVSGAVLEESSGGVWSENASNNDTLTFTPTSIWSDGLKNLDLAINDRIGNAFLPQDYTFTVDTISPSIGAIIPATNSTLNENMTVTVVFTESIDGNSIVSSGLLSSEGDFSVESNTLIISPITTWSLNNHDLTLDVNDSNGNALETLVLNYTIGCVVGEEVCSGACVNKDTDVNNCKDCNVSCSNNVMVGSCVRKNRFSCSNSFNNGTITTVTNLAACGDSGCASTSNDENCTVNTEGLFCGIFSTCNSDGLCVNKLPIIQPVPIFDPNPLPIFNPAPIGGSLL